MPLQFFSADTKFTLLKRRKLKEFMESLFLAEGKILGSLNYIFCSDEYLLNINREFLKHDYYTDIITFDISGPGNCIDGEIYISMDRVRDNAEILDQDINIELHRVIFHGALHLCGYKDKKKTEQIQMRSLEDKYLGLYFC